MKRSRMKPSTTPLRRKRGLRPRSPKMQRLYTEERIPLVVKVLAEREWCELQLPGICWGRSVCLHEPLTRARGGSITDESAVMASCGPCNTYVDQYEHAHAEGLLVHSWSKSSAPRQPHAPSLETAVALGAEVRNERRAS